MKYEERLKVVNIPSMAQRRARGDMFEAYKYTPGVYNSDQIQYLDDGSTRRGHEYKLKKTFCKTPTRQKVFSFCVTSAWNSLLSKVVNAPSVNSFKYRMDSMWRDSKFITDLSNPLPQTTLRNENLEKYEIQAEEQLTGQQPNNSCEDYVCMYVYVCVYMYVGM